MAATVAAPLLRVALAVSLFREKAEGRCSAAPSPAMQRAALSVEVAEGSRRWASWPDGCGCGTAWALAVSAAISACETAGESRLSVIATAELAGSTAQRNATCCDAASSVCREGGGWQSGWGCWQMAAGTVQRGAISVAQTWVHDLRKNIAFEELDRTNPFLE